MYETRDFNGNKWSNWQQVELYNGNIKFLLSECGWSLVHLEEPNSSFYTEYRKIEKCPTCNRDF